MTKLLEDAIKKVRELPEAEQDEAAELLFSVAAKNEPVRLDAETRAAVQEGMGAARRGEFVSDEEMATFWKQHGVQPRR